MSKRFLTNIDLTTSELQNAVVQNLASDPTTNNKEGRIYFNTSTHKLRVYSNGAWEDLGTGAAGTITSVLGTANEIDASTTSGTVTLSLPATINADLNGNAETATKLATSRTISLTGDVTGSASFDGSANASITATIATNSVELGTDTTGNYVASVSGTDGVSITGTGEGASVTIANSDKGSSQNIFKNVTDGTTTAIADNNDDTLTFSAGTGVSVSVNATTDTVTITNTDLGSSQNIFKNVSDGTTSVVADSNNDTLTISAGTGVSVTANATTDTLTVANTGVTSLAGTGNQIAVSGSTGSVTVSLPSAVTMPGTLTLNADPTQALHAATKQYVDNVSQGLHVHAPSVAATPSSLATITGGTVTYDNGTAGVGATLTLQNALTTLDGVTLQNGNRILVKNESNQAHNGIYTWATGGTVLTRATDSDTALELAGGDFTFVQNGTLYNDTGWVLTDPVNTVGTDSVIFVQFSGAGTYTAGNGLSLNGSQFSINTAITADLTSVQTLSNKTLTGPSISGLYISDNSIVVEGTTDDANETTLLFTNPTTDRTITFPDATGTVALTSDITSLTTSNISEGTNLYFTDERAQDAVGGIVSGSNSLSVTYNDVANTLSFDTTLAGTSYLTKTSGLAVDKSGLESAFVTDGFTKKYSASVGNGTLTSIAVVHNLGTRDAVVNIYDNTTFDTVEADVVRTDTNTVTVTFATAPTTNQYRVVVIG